MLALSFFGLMSSLACRSVPPEVKLVRFNTYAKGELAKVLTGAIGIAGALTIPQVRAESSPFLTGVDDLPFKRLAERAMTADSSVMDTGVLYKDVLYPSYFSGEWACSSTTKSVYAPLGIEAFGGASAWAQAQSDLGKTLNYKSRFLSSSSASEKGVIADRVFNINSIASAAVGSGSIMTIGGREGKTADSESLAQEIRVAMSPNQIAGEIFDVSLTTTGRDYYPNDYTKSNVDKAAFVAAEKVQQVISRRMDELMTPNSAQGKVKEIETISLYRQDSPTTISALQRTATFLSPLEQSSRYRMLAEKEPRVKTEAVDVRIYELVYTKP